MTEVSCVYVPVRECVCVCIINRVEEQVTSTLRIGKGDRWHPILAWQHDHIRSILKIHSRHSLSPHPAAHSSVPFLFLQFLLFSFINESESCFSEQEKKKRSWSHSTGQSNREMTGATGNDYLQLLFIYLFRRYLVPGLRKGRKAIFIFLMGLPSTDNVPVLFPFSWISHATKCAGNAKCCFCSSSRMKMKLFFIRN